MPLSRRLTLVIPLRSCLRWAHLRTSVLAKGSLLLAAPNPGLHLPVEVMIPLPLLDLVAKLALYKMGTICYLSEY